MKKRVGGHQGRYRPFSATLLRTTVSTPQTIPLLQGKKIHPARFPAELPRFFIEFLTDPGELVLDPFAGSNTTGAVAEQLGRQWIAVEKNRGYAKDSELRFHLAKNGSPKGQALLFE